MMNRFLPVLLLLAGFAPAAVLDIPYFGGKKTGAFDVVYTDTITPIHYFFWRYAPNPDTIRVGNVFSVRLYYAGWPPDFNSLCSQTGELGVQILAGGEAAQRKDSTDAWESSSAYPDSSRLALLPQVPRVDTGTPVISEAPGYVLGNEYSCEGTGYSLATNWKRTLYVQDGLHFAKFGIESMGTKNWGSIPYYGFIISVRFRYVLNDVNDLNGQASSVRHMSRSRIESRFGARLEHERYNPLGIRLGREPGRFEPAVAVPRKP